MLSRSYPVARGGAERSVGARCRVRSCALEGWRENPEKVMKRRGGWSNALCLTDCVARVIQTLLCLGYLSLFFPPPLVFSRVFPCNWKIIWSLSEQCPTGSQSHREPLSGIVKHKHSDSLPERQPAVQNKQHDFRWTKADEPHRA